MDCAIPLFDILRVTEDSVSPGNEARRPPEQMPPMTGAGTL